MYETNMYEGMLAETVSLRGANGDIINSQTGIVGFTGFTDPLDLIENPANGFIYLAEYGGQKLTLLKPVLPTPPTAPRRSSIATRSSPRAR